MNITYEHVMPGPTIIMAILIVIGVGGFSYWMWVEKNLKTMLMCIIRVIFLACLGWCMFMPELIKSDTKTLKPRFVVAVDASGSMELKPNELAVDRWTNLKGCFDMEWVGYVSEECEVDIWPFTSEVGTKITVDEVRAAQPEGEATLLRDSLRKITSRYAGQNVAGFVLLSDGIDTREAYDDWALQPWPFPIYTVRLEEDGVWEQEPDVHIDAVNTPRRVTVEWATQLKVALSGQGTKGQAQMCKLFRNGELYAEQPFQIPAGGGAREVVFQLDNPEIGVFNYKVVVPPVDGEKNTDDNVYEVTVLVIDAKNRLLYVEGHPRWESRFLKRMLVANKQATPLGFIMGPDGKWMTFGTRGSMTADMRMDQLAFFKIVILGNLDAEELTEARAGNLVKFVEDGGSLVVLGGLKGWGDKGLMNSKLKKVMPVKSITQQIQEGEFDVDVTGEGRSHPVFEGDKEFWDIVPKILSVFPDARMAAGAQALVSCVTDAGPQPLIVAHRYGQGKVVAILTDSIWKWKLSEMSLEHKPYERFWNQLLKWLTPEKDKSDLSPLEIFADREQLFLGEEVELSGRKGGKNDDEEFQSAEVKIMVMGPDKKSLPYSTTVRSITSETGKSVPSYVLDYKAEKPGIHKAFAEMTVSGRKITSDPVSFFVKPFTPETMPKPANLQVLRGIASSSQGTYFDTPDAMNDALMDLTFATLEREQKEYESLWNNWWVLGALVAIVTAGWVVRKLQNLP
jgi:hypothetical protein